MAVLMTPPKMQFLDSDGNPLAQGRVYTYEAGTTIPKATYTTASADVANGNPVILDAAGRASIWLVGSYDFKLTDLNDVEVYTQSNVTAFTALPASSDSFFQSFSGDGSEVAFTLSEDLGADEKAILVFVNDGLEDHVTNGTFATDSDWTKGSGWTIVAGEAVASTASSDLSETSGVTLVEGQAYVVTYTITRSAGSVTPSIGGTDGTSRSATGTYVESIVAGSDQILKFTGSGFTGTVDDVTVTPANSEGFNIQNPSAFTVSGTTLTFTSAPPVGTNNIYVFAPSLLVGAASSAAADAQASATAAAASEVAAAFSAAAAASSETSATASAAAAAASATITGQFVNVKTYGAEGDGVTDDTSAIQTALNDMDSSGGGTLFFPPGTYIISMAESSHSYACLVIPKNINILGSGMMATTFTRPSSERSTDGVLLVNKNYDLITNYGADGNIGIRHIGITDGATTPNRSGGDLIGFGNGDGLVVEYCYFGNHDQHAIDICKSRNVHVRFNTSDNQVNQSASATYQIDAGLIIGIAGTTLGSGRVYIHNNVILGSLADNIIHFHSECYAKDVFIYDNYIDATDLGSGQQAIGADGNISFEDVHIFRNTILLDDIGARGINFPIQDNEVTLCRNLRIYENTFRGVFRIAVFVGDDAQSLSDYNTPMESIYVYKNVVEVDLTSLASSGTTGRLIAVSTFKIASIKENIIRLEVEGSTDEIRCIEDNDNEFIDCSDNFIEIVGANTTNTDIFGVQSYSDFAAANSLVRRGKIDGNQFKGTNFKYNVSISNIGTPDADDIDIIISNSIWKDCTVITSNIYQIAECSDGTNNQSYIDFTGITGVTSNKNTIALSTSMFRQNIPLPGKVTGNASVQNSAKFETIFAPTEVGIQSDREELSFVYLSSTTVAGTQIADVHMPNGTFSLLTGVSGVSCVINNSTFQPVLRTSGYLKILCGV